LNLEQRYNKKITKTLLLSLY